MAQPLLNPTQRAELYSQLALFDSAGVAAASAFEKISHSATKRTRPTLKAAGQSVNKGRSISESGRKLRLFTEFEADVIHSAEQAGNIHTAYKLLSNRNQEVSSRSKRLKAMMAKPVFVLAIVMFIAPLPDLILSRISASEYLQRSLGGLIAFSLLMRLLWQVIIWLRHTRTNTPLTDIIDWANLRWPLIGPYNQKRYTSDFIGTLGLLWQSGLAIDQAATLSAQQCPNRIIQKRLQNIQLLLAQGQSLTQALKAAQIFDSTSTALIQSSEAAGRLGEGLNRSAALAKEQLGIFEDSLSEWLPRAAYSLVAIWIIINIFRLI